MTQPEHRTPAEIQEDIEWLRTLRRRCPGCEQIPCVCTDEATDLLLEEKHFGLEGEYEAPWGWDQ